MLNKLKLILLFFGIFIRSNPRPIIEITIPKTGTHLLAACISHLTYRDMRPLIRNFEHTPLLNDPINRQFLKSNLNDIKNLSENSFFHTHLDFNEFNSNLVKSLRPIGFFLLRDPRDQIISFMHWYYKYPHLYPEYNNLNPDDLISEIIKNTNMLYSSYLGWAKEDNFLTVKFEDLVGPKGNGSEKLQINTIIAIARHMNYHTSHYRAQYIAEILFGNSKSCTFREGKIGSWKKYFTSKHKKLCKEHLGQLLIDLKYEKNLNW